MYQCYHNKFKSMVNSFCKGDKPMYHRYGDIDKFITNPQELELKQDGEVVISTIENYDISVDLEERMDEFEELKPYIVFLAKNISKLDDMAQKFDRLYLNGKEQCGYELAWVYIDKPNIITLEYWGTTVNTQFLVVFEQKEQEFVLKSFGMREEIPEDWDKEV